MRIPLLLVVLIFSVSTFAQNFAKQNHPTPNGVCNMGGENGWSGWQASTGEYSLGIITYNVINISPTLAPNRFVLTSGAGIDACTPGPAAGSPALSIVA